ncbi:MAG: PHP domain-containing protein [Candidatus Hermodarchaeota archaeon]
MSFPPINLHIHSNFSDGKHSIHQIVKSALKTELEYIAITDHFTDSWKEWVTTLKNEEKISEYLEVISICQKLLRERNTKLKILKGLEIDLSSSVNFIRKINAHKFDLILFEYLQDAETLAFLKNILTFWRKNQEKYSRFPILGLAHFDPSYFIYDNLDILIPFLKENNVYFEFNSSYPDYYSRRNEKFFEELRKGNIPVAVGCDSHSIKSLDNIEEPIEMIQYYNLETNFQIILDLLRKKF